MQKSIAHRREQRAWYFYDWANSAFPTTVLTVFIGPYLTTIAKAAAGSGGFVYPLGLKVAPESFFPYVVSLSVLLQVIFLPLLGAIADYSHFKKQMLAVFAYVGAFATMGLYFLQGTNYLLGGALFLVANLSFGASIVFYNAFLIDIALPEERDRVSSMGWAIGYIGGGLLLALNLLLFAKASDFGFSIGEVVRINLASAGVWWAVFTVIPLVALKRRQPVKQLPPGGHYLTVGIRQLRNTLGKIRAHPHALLFLVAYLIYNDGIQTVISLASVFGQEELGLSMTTLTTVILMVQFVGFFGAILFNYIARAVSAKRAIIISLLIWIGTLVYAYAFLKTTRDFFMMAAAIAIVLGGSQALSRSVYSLMIPQGQESEYFGLYEISDKGTSWLGPLLFGLALQFTGSYRIAILSLIVFFVLGLLLLFRVNVRQGILEAGNDQSPTTASR
ncbi:MFS transporter [Sulfuricaulis sp.]|jgi:UMF1 family MFS transporter|uniref:MFS transporter n=1 Tax=Sulfuricaulis sp. TaxID=2003553 RepID=UPI0035599BB2